MLILYVNVFILDGELHHDESEVSDVILMFWNSSCPKDHTAPLCNSIMKRASVRPPTKLKVFWIAPLEDCSPEMSQASFHLYEEVSNVKWE